MYRQVQTAMGCDCRIHLDEDTRGELNFWL